MFDRNGDHRISSRELAAVIRQAIGGDSYISEDDLIKII